jgi:hypothetical protein
VQNIEAIAWADVQRVAREYINPTSLAIVIVGDRKSIRVGTESGECEPDIHQGLHRTTDKPIVLDQDVDIRWGSKLKLRFLLP